MTVRGLRSCAQVEPQLADARQIFMSKYLAGRCPDAKIITELAVDQAVKYFDNRPINLSQVRPGAVALPR